MCDLHRNVEKCQATKRRRRLWLVAVIVSLVAIAVCVLLVAAFWPGSRSLDRRLAEIEAARAIPDSENAAMIYNELGRDPKAESLLRQLPESVDKQTLIRASHEPWLSKDHPELAAWISEHHYIIDRLLDASRFEKCRFPITDTTDSNQAYPDGALRRWGYMLSIAANNDVAEGRIEAAIAEWRCLIQVSNHVRQQPFLPVGIPGESAVKAITRFIMEGSPTAAHMQTIEAMPLPLTDDCAKYFEEIRLVEKLSTRKFLDSLGFLDRLRYRYVLYRIASTRNEDLDFDPDPAESTAYLRYIASARGIRILIALNRYRSTTGRWPASLEVRELSLSEEILTDPLSGRPFAYEPAADMFRLYSIGRNKTDEDGEWKPHGGDDWPIWPPRGQAPEPKQEEP